MKRYVSFAALVAATLGWASITHAQASPGDITSPTINLRRTVTVRVVEQTKSAVVNISATKTVTRRVNPTGDPFFQQFDFGQTVRVPANSLGSGFIVHKNGYVVTNNHVVDQARQITVELEDGRKLPADLISTDPDADLAILRIHSDKPFPYLELGESNDLMIGEPVIAVGNPLGFSHSVSTGIVSAIHRDIDPRRQVAQQNAQPLRGEDAALRDLVQTDAAINPGNSGGPLLNAYGQVIAINTAIRGDAQNIGFAIPIDRLRDLIPELMNPSQVTKVDVPIKFSEKRVTKDPAEVSATVISTGAKPKTLSAINGQRPTNIIDAYAILLGLKVNEPINFEWSNNTTTTITPKATATPDAIVQAKQRFGLTIEAVTPMLAEKYQLAQEQGLFVSSVDRDSVGARAGLRAGDIIVQLGRYRVNTLDDFAALVQRLPESANVRVAVVRGNEVGVGTLSF